MTKKLIPGKKKALVYKKSSGFKMKSSPTKQMGHMGAVMGTGSGSGMTRMGMPSQDMLGLDPRKNSSGTTQMGMPSQNMLGLKKNRKARVRL